MKSYVYLRVCKIAVALFASLNNFKMDQSSSQNGVHPLSVSIAMGAFDTARLDSQHRLLTLCYGGAKMSSFCLRPCVWHIFIFLNVKY